MAKLADRQKHLQGWSDPVLETGEAEETVPGSPGDEGDVPDRDPTLPLPRHLHDLWVVLGLDE